MSIPLDLGKDNEGTDRGATYLREQGLVSMLDTIGVRWNDGGIIACPTRADAAPGDKQAKYLEPIIEVAARTCATIAKEVAAGKFVVALGGDHSLSLGTIAGASLGCAGDIGVVYIDAHADAMTTDNTLSGNVHGMPASAAMGFGHPTLTSIGAPGAKVKPENFVFIGLKDLDQGEIDLLRQEKITAETMVDITARGLVGAFEKISALQKRVKNIWVSFDLDVVDVVAAPGTPIQNYGGLTYREAISLAKFIGKTCSLVGFDLVELAPRLDQNGTTAKLAINLIAHLLGAEYSWYTAYMEDEAKKQSGITA